MRLHSDLEPQSGNLKEETMMYILMASAGHGEYANSGQRWVTVATVDNAGQR